MEIEFVGSQTDCGTSKNAIRVTLDPSIAEYYNIVKNEGKLTVEKRPVTLTSASGSKEYAGKPLTNHKVTVGEAAWGTGWVDGQGATYSFAGSQKIVGSSENVFECIPNEGTNLDNGFETLEFQINGQTFYVSGVEASATGTDAGEYPVTKSGQAVVTDAEGNDVTDQFTVNIDDAKLTIVEGEPAPIDPSEPSSSSPPDTKPTVVEGEPAPIDPSEPPSSSPSKTTGKTAASKSAKTGDGIAPYVIGICGVAIVAGAVAFVARRKGSSRR